MSESVLLPGFVDLGASFGEPGHEQAESIASGLAAAARGGYVAVALEPFTDPPIDSDAQVRLALHRAEGASVRLMPMAAAAREGGKLSEMALLGEAGAVGVSLGDALPASPVFLRHVLEYATQRGLTVFVHPCEPGFLAEGCVHEGLVSDRLGLRGIPGYAEEIGLGILLPLVRATGARVHLSRLSTAEGVGKLREAKREGLPLTGDVGFRHLLRDETAVETFDAQWRLVPPLRTRADRGALWEALLDGTLDAVCSHHRPVSSEEKLAEFDRSPAGATGLETAFGALWSARGTDGVPVFTLEQAMAWFCHGPRRVLGMATAPAPEEEGTWWDFEATWVPGEGNLASLSRNCPEIGHELNPVAVRLRRAGKDEAFSDVG